MKLVKIDHSKHINVDRIDEVVEYNPNETHIFIGGSSEPFIYNQPVKEVLDAINGDEGQSTEKSYSGVSKDGAVMNVITSTEYATVTLESNNECMGWKLNRKKISEKK